MYNRKYIIPMIVLFVVFFTAPFWLNIGQGSYRPPNLAMPSGPGQETCVEPAEWMRAEHMSLLNEWRNQVVREGKRVYTATDGREWNISLQNTCMTCHVNKVEFCDRCHDANNVDPYCWTCHQAPMGNK